MFALELVLTKLPGSTLLYLSWRGTFISYLTGQRRSSFSVGAKARITNWVERCPTVDSYIGSFGQPGLLLFYSHWKRRGRVFLWLLVRKIYFQ